MEIALVMINKTREKFIAEGMQFYLKKSLPYVKIETLEINCSTAMRGQEAKTEEGLLIQKKLKASDYICLLDEKGKSYDSVKFAAYLQNIFNSGVKRIVFVIGGAYGFSEELKAKANSIISLSPMTFSHQLVRIVFAEQLYRALNLMHGGKYHH